MKLYRFLAPDARAGLERIRRELGPDAVVISSRKTAAGIEFMAGRADELADTPAAPAPEAVDGEPPGPIRRELARLRAMLANQLAGLAWSADRRRHPVRIHVLQTLLSAGFGPRLARHVAAALPKGYSTEQADVWLRQVLIRNLRVFAADDMPGIQAGVWALVGPTGHGKTTTLAKLAARAVLAHGRERIALVSVDAWRVGAREQLAAYARMMGVDFLALDDVHGLGVALAGLRERHCVLIDSAGFAPADAKYVRQLAALGQAGAACLLTLSAGSQGALAESLLGQHAGFAGVVLTKLDEGGTSGAVLDCMMRRRLPLACLSSGQRVPQDLHAAHAAYVVDRALRARGTDGFVMREEDWAAYAGLVAEQESLRRSA